MLRMMQENYHKDFVPAEVLKRSAYFIDYVQKVSSFLPFSLPFLIFSSQTRYLQNLEPHTLSDTGKRVLFVNVYNSLTVHGICHGWPNVPNFHDFKRSAKFQTLFPMVLQIDFFQKGRRLI